MLDKNLRLLETAIATESVFQQLLVHPLVLGFNQDVKNSSISIQILMNALTQKFPTVV